MHSSLTVPVLACETVRRSLLAVLDRVTPAVWEQRPRADSWSVAEQWDHLVKSEIGTSKIVRRLIRGDYRALERQPQVVVHDSRLAVYPYGRLTAPAGLAPGAVALVDARAQVDAVHARFLEELARFAGPDADALAVPDPATGEWFTLGGWVRLQALHEAHHLEQIEALLGG